VHDPAREQIFPQGWTIDGGQAILTCRALAQRERFDTAWKMVAAEYQQCTLRGQVHVTGSCLEITHTIKGEA